MGPVYISTNCFAQRKPSDILRQCAENGYQWIELSMVDGSTQEAVRLARQLHREGVKVTLHNYYPPSDDGLVLNLASKDPRVLQKSRDFCRKSIDLSAEIGAAHYAAHAGFTADVNQSILGNAAAQSKLLATTWWSKKDCLPILAESIQVLNDHGDQQGIKFMIENHVNSSEYSMSNGSWLLCWEPSDFQALAENLQGNLRVLLDVGHLKVSARTMGASAASLFQQLLPWVHGYHLSENDGVRDSHLPLTTDSWFLGLITPRVESPLTLEFSGVEPEVLREAMAIISELRGKNV